MQIKVLADSTSGDDVEIIVKSYQHFNRALPNWNTPKGVYVKNKDHYDRLVKENNMISHDDMQRQAESKKLKDYKFSQEGWEIVKAAKNSKDSRGNVKLSDRTIAAMIKKGAIGKKIPSYMQLPAHYCKKGAV